MVDSGEIAMPGPGLPMAGVPKNVVATRSNDVNLRRCAAMVPISGAQTRGLSSFGPLAYVKSAAIGSLGGQHARRAPYEGGEGSGYFFLLFRCALGMSTSCRGAQSDERTRV